MILMEPRYRMKDQRRSFEAEPCDGVLNWIYLTPGLNNVVCPPSDGTVVGSPDDRRVRGSSLLWCGSVPEVISGSSPSCLVKRGLEYEPYV